MDILGIPVWSVGQATIFDKDKSQHEGQIVGWNIRQVYTGGIGRTQLLVDENRARREGRRNEDERGMDAVIAMITNSQTV